MSKSIQKHTATYIYAGQSISFHFWEHTGNRPPSTIMYLGTAQTGRIPQWVAQASPPGTVVVEGAPHWLADPSAEDLFDFMCGYTQAAFYVVRRKFGVDHLDIIAESQAVPAVVRLATIEADCVGNIALIAPLGFAAAFGDTMQARLRTLRRRTMRDVVQFAHSPWHDIRNLYVGRQLVRAVRAETEPGASARKYAMGLSYDMVDDFAQLSHIQAHKQASLTVLLGAKDKVFVPQKIINVLQAAHIPDVNVIVLPGATHASLAVRAGRRMLAAAFAAVNNRV